jgi:MscS family membrane protein
MQQPNEILDFLKTNRHVHAGIVILATLAMTKIVDMFFRFVIHRFTRRTKTDVDDKIFEAMEKPVFRMLLLGALAIAIRIEKIPETIGFYVYASIHTLIFLILAMLMMRIVTIIFHSMAEHPDRFHMVQPATLPVFEIGSKLFIFGGVAYFIMLAWKLELTGWLASAGIISIAVGFAAKDTLANLFAGVFILADAPYKIGDFIELEGQRGQVMKIGLRSTRILTRDDIEITIPNSTIANSKIINESGGPSVKHRVRMPIGVAYGSDIDRVRAVLEDVAHTNEYLTPTPEPRVRFRSFGDSSLNFEVMGWIEDPAQRGIATDSLNTAIYKALGKAGIEIPFPKRDVYIRKYPDPEGD